MQNIPPKFYCEKCDYSCSKKSSWDQHLSTAKHQKANEANSQANDVNEKYSCENCKKIFKHQSSYCRHKNKCKQISSEDEHHEEKIEDNEEDNETITDKELVLMVLKQNAELLGIVKNGTTNNSHNNTNTNSNHTNSHNKTFNLQFFLNDTCKNAMNIDDFVNDIVLTLKDLEDTGRLGFAEGISKIINRRLKELSVTERPIHCSDAKRETLYVKDKDKWEKEDEDTPILTKAVKNIAGKNMMQIFDWQKAHPDYSDPDTRTSDKYMKMLTNVMSGGTEEEINANYNKIVRNVIKEVPIDKERFSV